MFHDFRSSGFIGKVNMLKHKILTNIYNSRDSKEAQNAKWLIYKKYGVLCILFVYLNFTFKKTLILLFFCKPL